MSDLKIDFDWTDPLGARGAELRATWARLSITVDRHPVTKVYEERSKTVRDAIYLPLYPLAEWLAEQWWPLWNEPAPSPSCGRPGYNQRHGLVHAREGYALPPLRIEPEGSLVLVSWSSERLAAQHLEFLGSGEVWLETNAVKDAFTALIEAVVGRLAADGISESRLQQDWLAIRTADGDERDFCECAGALGLDPYALDESQEHEIEEAGNLLPGDILPEFFRAARASADELRRDAEEVSAAVARAGSNPADLTPLRRLRDVAGTWGGPDGSPPWEQGYGVARKLRSYLGLDGRPLASMESIGAAIGTTWAELGAALSRFSSKTLPFEALVGVNPKLSPGFVLRPGRPESLLFDLCRALFEYLCLPARRNALITDAHTERQKRNRAFAAEFLAPASALRARIRHPMVTWEETEEIAEECGVSAWVIAHQLANHRIASVENA